MAQLLIAPSVLRERFAENIYHAPNKNNPIGEMDKILAQVIATEPLEKKLSQAHYKGKIKGKNLEEILSSALSANVLVQHEADQILAVNAARMKIINVDDFGPENFK